MMTKFDRSLAMADQFSGELSKPIAETPRYPVAHFSGPEELDLPDSGTMLVEYKVVREVSSETEGRHWYECDIQLRRIVSAEAEKDISPSKRINDAGDSLDKLAEEYSKGKEKEGDD